MALGAILGQTFDGYTKEETLSDDIKTILGLGPNDTPDAAFAKLALGNDKFVFKIRLTYPNNAPYSSQPIVGATISGVTNLDGGTATTNDYGEVICLATVNNPTVSWKSPYIDVNSITQQVNKDSNYITNITLTATSYQTDSYNYRYYTSNASNLRISPFWTTLKICAVGAGEGGYSDADSRGGNGGAGGNVTNQNFELTSDTTITLKIQKGGAGESLNDIGANKPTGGQSGGTVAQITQSGSTKTCMALGGYYNRDNSNSNNRIRIFNDSRLPLAGGGDGGYGSPHQYSSYAEAKTETAGHAPNGGQGQLWYVTDVYSNGSGGKTPGGGGGGASGRTYTTGGSKGRTSGFPGGGGAVYIGWE